MGKQKNFAIGALIAAAAGYVAGILTAPKSGKETRQDIQDAAVKAKKDGEKKLKDLNSDLNKTLDQAKKKSSEITSARKKDFDKAVEAAGVARDKARTVLSAIHEGDAEDKDLKKAVDEGKKALKHLKAYMSKEAPKEDKT